MANKNRKTWNQFQLIRSTWTKDEDAALSRAVLADPHRPFTKWADLASKLGRTGKQCRDRWINYLDPELAHGPFSREDDQKLWSGYGLYGNRWVEISLLSFQSTRSENHVKNRFNSAVFRKFIAKEFGEDAYEKARKKMSVGRKHPVNGQQVEVANDPNEIKERLQAVHAERRAFAKVTIEREKKFKREDNPDVTPLVTRKAKKHQWTEEEDAVVSQAMLASPTTKFAALATRVPGRTGKQVRDRWKNYLNPALNHIPFTREDDLKLWNGYQQYLQSGAQLRGKQQYGRWVAISTNAFESTRSENIIKNRWYSAPFKSFVAEEFGEDAYEEVSKNLMVTVHEGNKADLESKAKKRPALVNDGETNVPTKRLKAKDIQWTKEEDATISRTVLAWTTKYGTSLQDGSPLQDEWQKKRMNWSDFADEHFPTRSGRQVRDRWVNFLNPVLKHHSFTPEEDLQLWEGQHIFGTKWTEIGTKVFHSTRSENAVKNRWNSSAFKKFVAMEFGPDAYKNARPAKQPKLAAKIGVAALPTSPDSNPTPSSPTALSEHVQPAGEKVLGGGKNAGVGQVLGGGNNAGRGRGGNKAGRSQGNTSHTSRTYSANSVDVLDKMNEALTGQLSEITKALFGPRVQQQQQLRQQAPAPVAPALPSLYAKIESLYMRRKLAEKAGRYADVAAIDNALNCLDQATSAILSI
ncbi:hypothetical protein ACHAXR_003146 [Thalassiosira sp. AJA248-18]